jgi:hypothetical protein
VAADHGDGDHRLDDVRPASGARGSRVVHVTRRRAIIGGVALAVLIATFAAGRYSRSPTVVTRDVVKTQTVEVEKVRTVTVHDVAEAKDSAEKVRTVTVTKYRWMPGGITEAETTTRAATDTDTHETKQAHTSGTQDRAVDVRTTTVELHTVTPVRPRWSVSLMPGAQLFGSKASRCSGRSCSGRPSSTGSLGRYRWGFTRARPGRPASR